MPWEHSRRHLDRAAALFEDSHSHCDPLLRYLPFIDLCFGHGPYQTVALESVGERLRLVAEGSVFEAVELRQKLGEFQGLEAVEKFDLGGSAVRVPEMLRRWARDCLVSVCAAPPFSLNVPFLSLLFLSVLYFYEGEADELIVLNVGKL